MSDSWRQASSRDITLSNRPSLMAATEASPDTSLNLPLKQYMCTLKDMLITVRMLLTTPLANNLHNRAAVEVKLDVAHVLLALACAAVRRVSIVQY
jgi:hypothetical protein